MATAREGNPYEGGGLGAGGKFRKRPFRRTQATPYDRPPTAIRNPSTSRNNGWFSKLVDPAQRLITTGAYRLFSSVFRKRLPPPPPSPSNPPPSETEQEVRDNHQEPAAIVTNDSSVEQQGAVGESDNQMNSSDRGGFTELEKLLKQKTFTRSEIDHLTALLHSKTVDSPVTEEEKRTEVVTSELMLSHEQKQEYPNSPAPQNGIENCLVSTPFVSSSVIDKDVASPAEVAKAYMGSRPLKVSPSKLNSHSLALREDLTLLRSQYFPPKSPIVSIVQRATSHENGFVTPRSRGRSAIYSMARTPYARVYPTSTLKGVRHPIEGGPSSSAQSALDHDMLSGSKKGTLKRRSSVLDNDIGSLGPMRRIRQKSNLITSRGLSSSVSASPLPLIKSGVHADSAQQPSSIMQKPLLLSEAKHSDKKLSAENIDDTMPSTSLPLISSKSSEMASKILQQLDKLVSPKEKSSELKLPTVSDKSPTKLSSSMLRGQALRSIETVDSSKFLDHMRDNNSDGLHENLSADAENLTSPKVKLENGPLKLVAPSVGLVPVVTDVDVTMPRKEIVSSAKSVDSSMMKSISYPPQKSRAFHMSAHEDYLDLDDDVYPNGGAVSLSTEKQMTDSTLVAEKTAATETIAQDMPSASSVAIPFKSSRMDDQTPDGTGDRHIIGERVDLSASITSSTPSPTFKPVGVTVAAATESTFGSDKSTLLNGSVAASPSFSFGNKVAFSTELTAIDAPSKELSKPGPVFSFGEKVVSSKESVADAPLFNFVANKNVDKVQQMPLTSSFSVGVESAGLKFGASSDSKLGNSVGSTPVAGATDSMPKAPESDKADAKTTTDYGFFVQSSELAVSSAASTSSLTSPSSIFSFGHSSNQNNGPHASKASFSSPFPAVVSNNSTSQNMLSCSSLGVSSSNAATVASTSSSMTTSTPVTIASSTNSSLSSSEAASSSPTTFFKFGSSPVLTTDLPMSSSGKQDAGFSILGSTAFGSSSAAVGSTGNSIFGLSSSAMTTVNSQSQGSLFGSSTSLPGAQAPPATSVFATSTQSQSIPLGSSASSPLFGLSANAAFSSGSSMFPSSSATNVFNSGTSFGLSASASSSAANTAGSNSGTASSLFGLTSWQSSKSPFGSAFSSLSSSGFSFGVSSGSVSSTTSSPMFGSSTDSVASTTSSSMFGSSTGSVASATSSPIFGSSTGVSSSPMFSFPSAAVATSTQPVFSSPNAVFPFGSAASVNNDQMSMEDNMAEDTVQSSSPMTPVFGQQLGPPQSNFVFGALAPSGNSPFQFGSQQNIAPQNPSPFQASGSLEFNPAGSFSLGTGGDKSGRKFVKVSKEFCFFNSSGQVLKASETKPGYVFVIVSSHFIFHLKHQYSIQYQYFEKQSSKFLLTVALVFCSTGIPHFDLRQLHPA